ncbi:MAG: hypothetical protein QFB86_03625 [Patescibacteria group bacterium]|nr:hypothetical protein [Patescibacteria group bacterium]
MSAETFYSNWSTGTWEEKKSALLARVDAATAKGYKVGLVGASAGAGAVINILAERQDVIVGSVLIAGKVNNPQAIGGSYRSKNAAFITSANAAPVALESLTSETKQHILSRHAFIDEVVPRRCSYIPGGINKTVPSIGHVLTIVSQLTLGAPSFISFLKKLA